MAGENEILNSLIGVNQDNSDEHIDKINGVLDANTSKTTNKYNIGLDETETKAREQGTANFNSGVVMTDTSGYTRKQLKQAYSGIQDASNTVLGAQDNVEEISDETNTNTSSNASSNASSTLEVSKLYKNLLGRTQYEDLKYKCGLEADESFTDYYNRTHYIPKGYEIDAKLLLAEERRMKLYMDYSDGNMSEATFLYQAYGKDLLKESGYNLDSTLYWYNRIKGGDYTNPLDNDQFLAELINNSRTVFQAEKWYESTKNAEISSSLAGIVTGEQVSTDKVYNLFKTQIDALSPYFSDDVNKVLTYYQAGKLGNAFNPLIDIDGDGKYDYYYHTNGKMYAIEGSSGVGDAKASIEYGEDGKTPHMVEIKEGAEGMLGQFFEGMGSMLTTIMDLGAMVWSATFGSIGKESYFVDNYEDYEAWKQRTTVFNDDVQILDGKNEIDYQIAKAIGTITSQVIIQTVLAVTTFGAGNVAHKAAQVGTEGAHKAITLAAKVAGNSLKESLRNTAIGAAVGAGVGATVKAIEGEDVLEGVLQGGAIGAMVGTAFGFSNSFGRSVGAISQKISDLEEAGQVFQEMGKVRSFFSKGITNTLKLAQFVTKGNSGAMFNGSTLLGRAGNASILAIKDFASTAANLAATNNILKYYENEVPESGIKSLTEGEIFARAGIIAGVDLGISTALRLQGESGVTTFGKQVKTGITGTIDVLDENGKVVETYTREMLRNMSSENRQVIYNISNGLAKMPFEAGVDNVFDVVENLLTSATQAAVNNPYAELGSGESWKTFAQSMVTPQSVIQNLYVTARNVADIGGNTSTLTSRLQSLTLSKLPNVATRAQGILKYLINHATSTEDVERYKALYEEFSKRIGITTDANGKKIINGSSISEAAKNGTDKSFQENVISTISYMDEVAGAELLAKFSVNELQKVFGLTAREAKNVKEAVESGKVKGLFTALLFGEVKAENAEYIIKSTVSQLNQLKVLAAREEKIYTDIFYKGMRKAFTDDPNQKNMMERNWRSFKFLVDGSQEARGKQTLIDINDKIEKFFPVIEEMITIDALENISKEDLDKNFNVEIATNTTMFKDTSFKANRDDKTGAFTLAADTNVDAKAKPTILKVLSNVELCNWLIKVGLINYDEKAGTITFPSKPWMIISAKPEMNNNLKSGSKASEWLKALDTLVSMSLTQLPSKEYLINIDSPLVFKTILKEKNSSGEEVERTYYIVPSSDNMSNLEVASRLEASSKLISAILTLRSTASSTDVALHIKQKQALVYLGANSLMPGLASGSLAGLNNEKTKWTEEDYRRARLVGIADILAVTDTRTAKAVGGFSRVNFLKMMLNGTIAVDDIKEVIAEYEAHPKDGGVTKAAYDAAKDLDDYFSKQQDAIKINNLFVEYKKKMDEGKTVKWSPTESELVVSFFKDITKNKEKQWVYDALKADEQLSDIVTAFAEDPQAILPFCKGLEDIAQSLVPSNMQAESSNDVLIKAAQKQFDDLARTAFTEYKKVGGADKTITALFRKSIRRKMPDLFELTRLTNEEVNNIAKSPKNLAAMKAVADDALDFHPNQTNGKAHFTHLLDYDVANRIYNKVQNAKSIYEIVSIFSDEWDSSGTNNDIEQYIKAREDFHLKNAIEMDKIRQEGSKLLDNDFYENNKNINMYELKNRIIQERKVGHISKQKANKFLYDKNIESFYLDYDEVNAPITQFYSLRDAIRTISGFAKQLGNSAQPATITDLNDFMKQIKVTSSSYTSLLKLSESDLYEFVLNPLTFLEKQKSLGNNSDFSDEVIEQIKKEYASSEAINLAALSTIYPVNTTEELWDVLNDSNADGDKLMLKEYVMFGIKIAEGDITTGIPDYSLLKSNTNEIQYNGKNVYDILDQNRGKVTQLIAYQTKSDVWDMIASDCKRLNKLYYENTETIDNPNIIEVNPIDLLPKQFADLLTELTYSKDLATTLETESKAGNFKSQKIENILKRKGTLNYQLEKYLNFIAEYTNATGGVHAFAIDLSDAEAVNNFKKTLNTLGYSNSDIEHFMNHELVIPGVRCKNVNTKGIAINVNSQDALNRISKHVYETTQKVDLSLSGYGKDYNNLFENMYNSVFFVDDDMSINIDKEHPTKLFGVFNDLTSDVVSGMNGLDITSSTIKLGTAGGTSSKVKTQFNKALAFSETSDPLSKNTMTVVELAEAIKYYFSKDNPVHRENIEISVDTQKEAEGILKEAKKSGNALFIPNEAIAKRDSKYVVVFEHNQNFDVDEYLDNLEGGKFNILKLLPIYTKEINEDGASSNQTLYELIEGMGIPGIETNDDLVRLAANSISIYSLKTNDYKDAISEFTIKHPNATVKDLRDWLKDTIHDDKYSNNYWLNALNNYIESGIAITNKFKESISKTNLDNDQPIDMTLMGHKFFRRVLGTAMNSDEFNKVIVKQQDGTEKTYSLLEVRTVAKDAYDKKIAELTIKVKQMLADQSSFSSLNDPYIDDPAYYSREINSASMSKLNLGKSSKLSNINDDVLKNTIDEVIREITGYDSIYVSAKTSKDFVKHNSLAAALSVIDEQDGKLFINLDGILTLTKEDQQGVIDILNDLLVNKDEVFRSDAGLAEKAIKDALAIYKNKLKEAEDLDMYKKTGEERITSVRYQPDFPNQPIPEIKVDGTVLTVKGKMPDADIQLLTKLASNNFLAKNKYKKFISLSSLSEYDPNSDYSPFFKGYINLLNETLLQTSDKGGHSMIYNMNSREAVSAFVNTSTSFAKALQEFEIDGKQLFTFNKADDKTQLEALMKIAYYANLYSTGTTHDAEYTGSLVVTYDDEGNVDIKPIVVSSADADKGVFKELLFGDKNLNQLSQETDKKHVLINLSKNTFKQNISGYDSGVSLIDLDDANKREEIIKTAIYKARDSQLGDKELAIDSFDINDVITKYYLDGRSNQATWNDRINYLKETMTNVGINEEIQKSVLTNVESLKSSNITNMSEQQRNDFIKKNVMGKLGKDAVNNKQLQAAIDVFIHGISRDALSDEAINSLSNLENKILSELTDERFDLVDSVANNLDDILDDLDNNSEAFKTLTDDEKAIAIKLNMLRKKTGADLEYILSTQDGKKTHESILKSIEQNEKDAWVRTFNEQNGKYQWANWEDILPERFKGKGLSPEKVLTQKPTLWMDSEWLYTADNKRYLYQLSFIQKPAGENIDASERNQGNVYIKDSFIRNEPYNREIKNGLKTNNTLYYVEDNASFNNKKDSVLRETTGKPISYLGVNCWKLSDGSYVTQTVEDAHILFDRLNSSIDVMVGYNQTADGSDISFFKETKAGQDFLNRMMQVDIRNHVLANTLSNDELLNKRTGEALDYFRQSGIIKGTRVAHDALSDIEDTIELYEYIRNNKMDVSSVYDSKYNDLKKLVDKGLMSEDALNKALTFNLNTNDFKLKDGSTFNSNSQKKGNTALNRLFGAFNTQLDYSARRATNKTFASTIRDLIDGKDISRTAERVEWHNAVKNPTKRETISNIIYNVITEINSGKNVNNMSEEEIKRSFYQDDSKANTVVNIITKAIELYHKENSDKATNRNDTFKFFSQDEMAIVQYINRAMNKTDVNDRSLLVNNSGDFFTKTLASGKNVVNMLVDSNVVDIDDIEDNQRMYRFSEFVVKPLQSKVLKSEEAKEAPKFYTNVIRNLCKMFGAYDNNYKNKIKNKHDHLLAFTSKLDQSLKDWIVDQFEMDGGLYYSSKALYTMGSEKGEFNSSILREEPGEFGAAYIGKKVLEKAFPNIANTNIIKEENGKKYFYTQVWRQPGEGKTTHLMKVYIDEGSNHGFQMTRSTALSYFDGDFDGDKYFISQPDQTMQNIGSDVGKYLTVGSGLLNVFGDVNYDSSNDTKLEMMDTFSINNIADMDNVYKAFMNRKADTDIQKQYDDIKQTHLSKLQQALRNAGVAEDDLSEYTDIYMETYFPKLVQRKDLGYYLYTQNKNFLSNTSLDKDAVQKIMDEGRTRYVHSSEFGNVYESQLIGAMAKDVKNNNYGDQLFNADIALSKDSLKHLNSILKNLTQDEIKDRLIKYVQKVSNEMTDVISKDISISLIDEIQNFNGSNLNAISIMAIAQDMQKIVDNSEAFQNTLARTIKDNSQEYLSKYLDKLSVLEAYAKEQPLSFNYVEPSKPIDQMSGIEVANRTAELLNKMRNYMADGKISSQTFSNRSFSKLFNKLMVDGDLNVKYNRDTEVITAKGNSSAIYTNQKANYTGIGLAPMRIMVLDDDTLTDSAYLTSNCKLKSAHVIYDNYQNKKAIYDELIKFNGKTLNGKALNEITKTNKFNNWQTYTVSEGEGKTIAFVSNTESLASLLNRGGSVKLGNANGKALKVTVEPNLSQMDFVNKDTMPDLIVNKLAIDKFSSDANYKQVADCEVAQSNGAIKKYKVYEVNDMTLLDSIDDADTKTVKDRPGDKISILQGIRDVTSFINYGTLAIEVDDDGKITVNPNGINEINNALKQFNQSDFVEANAASELNAMKITSLLQALDKEDRIKFISQIPNIGINASTMEIDDVLNALYVSKDIGGKYGDSIVDSLIHYIINKKDNADIMKRAAKNKFFRVAFSQEVRDAGMENQITSTDVGTVLEFFKTRKQFSEQNRRTTNMYKTNTMEREAAMYADSAEDNTSYYYGRRQALQDLLNEVGANIELTKSFVNQLYSIDGYMDTEDLIKGSIANGFNPINANEATKIDVDKMRGEANPLFKAGSQYGKTRTSFQNNEPGNGIGIISKSNGAANTRTNSKHLDSYLTNNNYTDYRKALNMYTYSSMMPFLSDGSDVDIAQKMNNNKLTAQGTIDKQRLAVTDNSLGIDTVSTTINETQLDNYNELKNTFLKSPAVAELTSEKINSYSYKAETLKEDNLVKAVEEGIKARLAKGDAGFIQDILTRYANTDPDIFESKESWTPISKFLKSYATDEKIKNAINLSSLDNGIELQNAYLRSWGFKSKDNKDISLGQRTIYLKNQVAQIQEKILGDEYNILVYAINEDPSIGNMLDKYMEAKYKLDIYDRLTGSEKNKFIKHSGQAQYEEMVRLSANSIIGTSGLSIEEARAQLSQSIKSMEKDPVMFRFIDPTYGVVSRLNKRLLEVAEANNPYALIGYFLPTYQSDKKKDKSFLDHVIKAWEVSSDSNRGLLNGFTKDGGGKIDIVSKFYDEDEGYMGLITRVAQTQAIKSTMKNFSSYLQRSGYMRNADVVAAANSFIDQFKDDFVSSFRKVGTNSKRFEYDSETYNILAYNIMQVSEGNVNFSNKYVSPQDFVDLFNHISGERNKVMAEFKVSSRGEIESLYRASASVGTQEQINEEAISNLMKLDDIYQNTLAVMINIMEENSGAAANTFLKRIYASVKDSLAKDGYDLVDARGVSLTSTGDRYPVAFIGDVDDIITEATLNHLSDREAEIAKLMLTGDVFLMRKSVSEQLEKKVFTTVQPNAIARALNKAKGYITGFIMATPMNLIDRKINFTMFDIGTLGAADARAVQYIAPSIAAIEKYAMHPEYVTEETVKNDKGLQYLLRYMAATGQSPINNKMYEGDSFDIANIPLIREYMSFASNELSKQQFYVRLAYFMDLVENGEERGFNLDPTKFGVAFHLREGLKEMDTDANAQIYRSLMNFNELNGVSDEDYINKMASMDAAAVQVVAENVGVFGNMPYLSKTLSNRFGMMFTGFPLAAVRWGANRFQSLAYAFTNFTTDSESRQYLKNNIGSTAGMFIIMAALQILLSKDSQEWLKKKVIEKKSDEEIKDELGSTAVTNAKNILFRGGCVRPFNSLLLGEESTSAGQSRGMIENLWNTYASEYLLKDKDESYGDVFKNYFMQNVWGHQNAIIKDVVEAIPGQKFLQTYNWFEPGDNYIDNISRKAAGYFIGNAQANSFFDSMKASKYENTSFANRLKEGARRAFIDDNTGIKSYKSSFRNYKKAFSVIYKYKNLVSTNADASSVSSEQGSYSSLKDELMNALQEKTSASAFYNIIQKYIEKGVSLSTIKSAVTNCSIRKQLIGLEDIGNMSEYLSDSEMAVIKSALAYEDYMFPYLVTYIEELEEDYKAAKSKEKYSSYEDALGSVLKTMKYNSSNYNSNYRNTNYNNYLRNTTRYNNLNNYNKNRSDSYYSNKNSSSPMDTYNNMISKMQNGISTDIWGNKTQHYTDGSSYQIKNKGVSLFNKEE